ncbi:hypothetical protein [Pseudomonas phage ZQG1]|nr:hypothetical protein [Pseudomonas phage ZQG1]
MALPIPDWLQEKKLIRELPDGQFRECTKAEIDRAYFTYVRRKRLEGVIDHAEKQRAAIIEGCKHPVCFDDPGFPYNTRICLCCGHVSLL